MRRETIVIVAETGMQAMLRRMRRMFFGVCLYRIQGSYFFEISSNKAAADLEDIFDKLLVGFLFTIASIARYIGE
jgi:hypothetical protein